MTKRTPPAEASDAAGELGDHKTLDQLLVEAQARIDEQREAWLRALADAENARKRAQADITAAHKYAVERLAVDLLPVLDSLEAALGAMEDAAPALRDGVALTLRQLNAAFEKANLAEIAPSAGERFDPHRHQAMAAVDSALEPNTVVAVMQKGYRLHDRTLRPALVTVSKPLEKPAGNPISDTGLDTNTGTPNG